MQRISLTVDSRKRISLTKLIHTLNVRTVRAYWKDDKIVLEPMVEVPVKEAWLYENEKALKKVKTGLSQKGTVKRGSFARYAKD